MTDHHTFIELAGGIVVLLGVYAVIHLLKRLADFLIFLIVLADAVVACSIHLWYPALAETFDILPTQFGLEGWTICMVLLTALGTLAALPFIPFSSAYQRTRLRNSFRNQRRPELAEPPPQVKPGALPMEHFYQWDSYHDRET